MSTPVILTAPPSKSLSHRAIIAACLAKGTSRLSGLLESDDTKRTMAILEECGAMITRHDKGDYSITGMEGTIAPNKELDCFVGESGTTGRLLTAVLAAGKGHFYIHGEGRMHDRPMGELLDILTQCGSQLEFEQKQGFLPFKLSTNGLRCPAVPTVTTAQSSSTPEDPRQSALDGLFIPANESSQYLSGLALAAPLSQEGLSLIFDGANAVSKSYILLTLQTLLQHKISFALEIRHPETGQWISAQDALSLAPAGCNSPDKPKTSATAGASGTAGISGASADSGISGDSGTSGFPKESPQDSPSSSPTKSAKPLCDMATLTAIKRSPLWQEHIRLTIPQSPYHPLNTHIEGDFSGASYLLAAGALGQHPVTVRGLSPHSLQGDSAILSILERMGALVEWSEENGVFAVTVSPAPLHGIDIDMGDCPDLVPTVAILAARASSPTTIRNVSHLALKESNRLLAPAQELAKIGCTATISPDSVTFYPLAKVMNQTPTLSSHDDHRMAMSLALLELGGDITLHLDNERCVSKSYPDFWQDWHHLRPHSKLGKSHA